MLLMIATPLTPHGGASSQTLLADDFNDGNFSANPTWIKYTPTTSLVMSG